MAEPIIIFVQAHGGGSDRLDGKFLTFNNYRKSSVADASQRITNPLFPIIFPKTVPPGPFLYILYDSCGVIASL